MNEKPRRGRQWEEGIALPVSQTFCTQRSSLGSTITEQVYNELRRMILYDDIKPGCWLRQDQITSSLEVSRTPVREALRSLNREGLVELVPNYGAKVSELTIDEFEEIYAHRKGIEGLAVRRSVKKLSFEMLETLQAHLDALRPLVDSSRLKEYLLREWSFRYTLYQVGGRERFLEEIRQYRQRAERYLRYAYSYDDSIKSSFDFHVALLEAGKRADGAAAERIVQEALSWTLEKAVPIIRDHLSSC